MKGKWSSTVLRFLHYFESDQSTNLRKSIINPGSIMKFLGKPLKEKQLKG